MIKIENISKSFGDNLILDKVDLNINHGETVSVLGKSGIGKSVLLKCLVRLIEPDSGKIQIDGKSILDMKHSELNEVRKEIGFLFQSGALYDSMRVSENLAFPLRKHTKLTHKEISEKIVEALDWVNLSEAKEKYPSELSGGMRKRVALARALITSPKVMLYDEPTTGLDPITTKEITNLILTMQMKFKMTSVVVTHDLIVADGTSDRALMLNDGKFIFEGTMSEMHNSTDTFIKEFLSNHLK